VSVDRNMLALVVVSGGVVDMVRTVCVGSPLTAARTQSLAAPFVFVSMSSADGRTRVSSAEPIAIAGTWTPTSSALLPGVVNAVAAAAAVGGVGGGGGVSEASGERVEGSATPIVLYRRAGVAHTEDDIASGDTIDASDEVVCGVSVRSGTISVGAWQRGAPFGVANTTSTALRLRWARASLPQADTLVAQLYRRANAGDVDDDRGVRDRRRQRCHWYATTSVRANASVALHPPPMAAAPVLQLQIENLSTSPSASNDDDDDDASAGMMPRVRSSEAAIAHESSDESGTDTELKPSTSTRARRDDDDATADEAVLLSRSGNADAAARRRRRRRRRWSPAVPLPTRARTRDNAITFAIDDATALALTWSEQASSMVCTIVCDSRCDRTHDECRCYK
jgi:hypothetical protein